MGKANRRKYPREILEGRIYLWWQDTNGRDCVAHGTCVDVSAHGVQLEVSHPISARTLVYFRLQEVHLTASATVRYCRPRGRSYRVGLEVSGQDILQQLAKAGAGTARIPAP